MYFFLNKTCMSGKTPIGARRREWVRLESRQSTRWTADRAWRRSVKPDMQDCKRTPVASMAHAEHSSLIDACGWLIAWPSR